MCGSHSCNQEEVLNSDWWRACHTMSQCFPGKNPGELPGDFLRTPAADGGHAKALAVPK